MKNKKDWLLDRREEGIEEIKKILEDKEFNTLKLDSIDTYQFPLKYIENISFKDDVLVIKLKKGYENE